MKIILICTVIGLVGITMANGYKFKVSIELKDPTDVLSCFGTTLYAVPDNKEALLRIYASEMNTTGRTKLTLKDLHEAISRKKVKSIQVEWIHDSGSRQWKSLTTAKSILYPNNSDNPSHIDIKFEKMKDEKLMVIPLDHNQEEGDAVVNYTLRFWDDGKCITKLGYSVPNKDRFHGKLINSELIFVNLDRTDEWFLRQSGVNPRTWVAFIESDCSTVPASITVLNVNCVPGVFIILEYIEWPTTVQVEIEKTQIKDQSLQISLNAEIQQLTFTFTKAISACSLNGDNPRVILAGTTVEDKLRQQLQGKRPIMIMHRWDSNSLEPSGSSAPETDGYEIKPDNFTEESVELPTLGKLVKTLVRTFKVKYSGWNWDDLLL